MNNYCFKKADVLLPKEGTDLAKWSVIACDQYTSDLNYWQKINSEISSSPSTLHFIIPEIYLEIEDESQKNARIENINKVMEEYSKSIFDVYPNSLIYVERTLKNGRIRRGIVGMVDLEKYDYAKDSKSEIRATEATVSERLPPRIKIRSNAPIESPHVLVLYEDKENKVVNKISEIKNSLEKVYDFELIGEGGSVKGYILQSNYADETENLINNVTESDIKFAVGDGNHSLATAKECYELLKKRLTESEYKNHPSRYALVEAVNIYDESLDFEPIYRVMFGVDADHLINELKNSDILSTSGENNLTIHCNKTQTTVAVDNSKTLTVDNLQKFLDGYMKKYGGRIDYIHGEKETVALSEEKGNVGFIFDTIKKDGLFSYISANGPLQKKTFSMGEADDKRYYLECRLIK